MKIPLIIIAILLFLGMMSSTETYDTRGQVIPFDGGCAWDDCPDFLKEISLEETNGLLPPQYYEKDTKDYWRSYCTYSPTLCK